MRRTVIMSLGFVVSFACIFNANAEVVLSPTLPALPEPQAQSPASLSLVPVAQAAPKPALPVRVSIPSLGINDAIDYMGLDALGNMDVPSTHSKNVGWYKDGTIPGNKGSAVFDAHVVAAFKNLSKIKNGADIYVTTDTGSTLHFKVQRKQTYNLADLSPDTLFNLNDTQRLNLITCAGKSLGGGNYTKRFVAFAVLVDGK